LQINGKNPADLVNLATANGEGISDIREKQAQKKRMAGLAASHSPI